MSTKSENGLMSKKKAELIDIILRKDDVERELRKELDSTKLDFDKAKKMIEAKETKIDALNEQVNGLREAIDDNALESAEQKYLIRKYKRLTIFFVVTTIVATALIFVF